MSEPERIPTDPALPSRILIVRLSHLGDVVCTLGILHSLHEAYPDAQIAWAVQTEFAGVLSGMPGLTRVIRFDRRGGVRAWLELRRELRDFHADFTVDAQGNLKSAAVTALSGASRRAGFARSDWTERSGSLVLNDSAPKTPADMPHVIDRMGILARHVAPGVELRTDPALTASELAEGERRLSAHCSDTPVLVHLSSPEDVRSWPLEHWLALILSLEDAGRQTLVLAGPAEARAAEIVAERLPRAACRSYWTGAKDLRALAALFASAARRGGVLASTDSGPMHLAWSVGLRVVALEGPYDSKRTGPWPASGAGHRVLRSATPPACAPCMSKRCRHADGPVCMTGIRTEDVFAALQA